EFLDYSLNEALKLTDSKIGYIYFYDEGSREFTLSSWSKEVMKECAIPGPPTIYQLEKTGIWGEVVKQRVPIIVNDFQAPNPLKKGYPEGHVSLIRWMSIPIFSNEKIVAVVGVANSDSDYGQDDINQLALLMSSVWNFVESRKMEETIQFERDKLTSILNSMEDGVCIMNRDHDLEYVNPSIQYQYGNIDGRKCYQYFNGLKDVCSLCNNEEVFSGKTVRRETELTRAGIIYEITDTPLRNFDGTLSKLALFHDITERKKAEQMKDEFIGLVSHELRTPLTVIIGSLRTAMSEGLSRDDYHELLQNAAEGADSLNAMLENMLELSRHQVGRLQLRLEPVSIVNVARGVIEKLKNQGIRHQCRADIPMDLPQVEADPMRVERILYNLLENAIKYSPEGSEINVSSRMEGDFVLTAVIDHGSGIAPQNKLKLFQLFQRLDASSLAKGAGLGLVVCQRLVEAQGGWIRVDSELGKGSTFTFALPQYMKKAIA
ncbi:MAG: GAF domain-containing protein, partial [Dehalococcoidales bacterium]|nr:GAF domain-containing protein [Dehalococcoidales bacterium]